MGANDEGIDGLRALPVRELQEEWRRQLGTEPPGLRSVDVVARILAWRVQEREQGGLEPSVTARLRRLGSEPVDGFERPRRSRISLSPGTTLVREWQGGTHHVRVTESGFEYAGGSYGSLSEVAREITGARWSGPRFFNLNEESRRKASA